MAHENEKTCSETENEGCAEFYSIAEVAVIARMSRRSVERMVAKGIVSSTKLLHKRLIPRSEVHGLLKENWKPAIPPE